MVTVKAPNQCQRVWVHLVPSRKFLLNNHPSNPNEIIVLNFPNQEKGCHTFLVKCMVILASSLVKHMEGLDYAYAEEDDINSGFRIFRVDFRGKDWKQAYSNFCEKLSGEYQLIMNLDPFHCR